MTGGKSKWIVIFGVAAIVATFAVRMGGNWHLATPTAPADYATLQSNWGFELALLPGETDLTGTNASHLQQEKVQEIYLNLPGKQLRITAILDIDPATARQNVLDKVNQLVSIYEPTEDPYYPGVKQEITCPEDYRIRLERVERPATTGQIAIMFANDRQTIGACTADLAVYRALLGFFVCERSRKLFRVEYFVAAKDYQDREFADLKNFSCR